MRLEKRFQLNRPLEEMEVALVRAAAADPRLVDAFEEAVLRTALSLARLYKVWNGEVEVGVGAHLAPFREEVTRRLAPLLLSRQPPTRARLAPLVRDLRVSTLAARSSLEQHFRERISVEAIDQEIRFKRLVLVLGGGGGTAYVYLGALDLLDELGLCPSLLVGSSMGAVLALFRARSKRFDLTETLHIVRGLSWRKLFRIISTESRYGLPAAMRLFLRAGIGRHFNVASESHGAGIKLSELPIPTIIAVGGIRRGMLPHPLEFYEKLLHLTPRSLLEPLAIARKVQLAMGAFAELFLHPEVLAPIHLGTDALTSEFDALDAAGFSASVPGVIHYDVLRDDPGMHQVLGELFESRGLFRLVDGGFADNLPARAAWHAVHTGRVRTRNVLICGLDGFSPRISTPLWLPLERLAALTVAPNLPYAHMVRRFRRTLSPLELIPSVALARRAVEIGRAQLAPELPFLCRMLTPLPRL